MLHQGHVSDNTVLDTKLVPRSRYPRDQAQGFVTILITSPLTRKRKTVDAVEESSHLVKQTKLREDPRDASSGASALNTPPLTTMDSDDEFMSGQSSQDEDDDSGVAQESDDGSLGDGVYSS